MGRGLAILTNIKANTVLAQCELLVFDAKDTIIINSAELGHYMFAYSKDQDCLCLGVGELFNHSDTANVSYSIVDVIQDNRARKVLQFVAICDIAAGEQLFINYSADVKINTNEYVVAKSMIGS